jgi:hypothetical protein
MSLLSGGQLTSTSGVIDDFSSGANLQPTVITIDGTNSDGDASKWAVSQSLQLNPTPANGAVSLAVQNGGTPTVGKTLSVGNNVTITGDSTIVAPSTIVNDPNGLLSPGTATNPFGTLTFTGIWGHCTIVKRRDSKHGVR